MCLVKVITGHVGLRTCVHSWASVQILICLVITFTVRKPFPFFPFVGTIVFDERERERERAIVRMKERKSVPSCSVCVLSNHVSHMLFKILTKITLNIVTQKLKIALDVFTKYSV